MTSRYNIEHYDDDDRRHDEALVMRMVIRMRNDDGEDALRHRQLVIGSLRGMLRIEIRIRIRTMERRRIRRRVTMR